MKIREVILESTNVVYHGTSEDRVPMILAHGLKVDGNRGIYASPDKEMALRWATQRAKERVDWEPEKLKGLKIALFALKGEAFGGDHDPKIIMSTNDVPVKDILGLEIYRVEDMPKFPLSNHVGDEWRNPRPIKTKQFVSEKIGPHSGKKASMLIAGTKPAGIIYSKDDMRRMRPYIRSGQLIYRRMKEDPIKMRIGGWVVAQKNEKAKLDRLAAILKNGPYMDSNNSMDPYHRELGSLLGYDQADIDHFIEQQHERGYW